MIAFVAIALVGYLIGSVPSGYIAGRIAGIDIRTAGSGNIGATNVTRVLGKRYGYPVFFADFAKGMSAVGVSMAVGKQLFLPPNSQQLVQIVAAVSCVLGNAYPVWLRFRGGKGVATSAGILFGLMPLAALVGVVVWVVTFEITRYVSVASIAATVALPITVLVMTYFKQTNESLFLYFTICLAAIVILRHRSNLSRLLRGTEQRFRRE
jgi:glycerol-3-phosphate acyltransferase PlsY